MDYQKGWERLYSVLMKDQEKDSPLAMSCFANEDSLHAEMGRRAQRNAIIRLMDNYKNENQ